MSKLDDNYEYFTGDGHCHEGEIEVFSTFGHWNKHEGPTGRSNIYRIPKPWEPKCGDWVLVKMASDNEWYKKLFICKHNGMYFTTGNGNPISEGMPLVEWSCCKPLEEPQPLTAAERLEAIKKIVDGGNDLGETREKIRGLL